MLSMGAATLIVLALVYAFWPKATLVDIGTVTQGAMQMTINEEAHTQVTELYTVSAPISGHLLRTTLKPNDTVEQQKTIVARILRTFSVVMPPVRKLRILPQVTLQPGQPMPCVFEPLEQS